MWDDIEFPHPIFYQLLEGLADEPDGVKGTYLYLLCRQLHERGLLELRGRIFDPQMHPILVYRDPKTGVIYEIAEPHLSPGEEQLAMEDLKALIERELRRH